MKLIKRLATMLAMVAIAATASAQLPSTQLKNIEGKVVDTAELSNDGKPFVISFFATWCKPCLRELKAIHEMYPDWQDETGMKLIAVSIDDSRTSSRVKPLVDAQGWEYEVLLDPNSEFMRQLGIQSVPHVLVIDGEGKIIENRSGYTDGGEEHIIELIRESINK